MILLCPDCQQNLNQNRCPSCGRNFILKNGVINALPLRLTTDTFKTTEHDFWNYTYEQRSEIQKPEYLEFHEHFLAPLAVLGSGSYVLEIAAGVRGDGLTLLKAGINVVETDISVIALAQLKKRCDNFQFPISNFQINSNPPAGGQNQKNNNALRITDYGLPCFIACDAEALPFPDNTFDGTFIAASFHHLPDPIQGLAEMARVTKPHGLVIVAMEPNHWPYQYIFRPLMPIKKWIRARRGRPIDSIADDTTQGFRKRDLIKLFGDAQLEIIEIRPVKFLLELLDSGTRFISLVVRRPLTPPRILQKLFSHIDKQLAHVPIINRLFWHWTVIGKKRLDTK